MSDAHDDYVENALRQYLENALMLNINNYHNIHVQRQPNTTETSRATHMATILANPCFTPAIPRNRTINPRFLDSELISRHVDRQFIVNLSVSYYERI